MEQQMLTKNSDGLTEDLPKGRNRSKTG